MRFVWHVRQMPKKRYEKVLNVCVTLKNYECMIIQDTIYTHASTPHRKDLTRTGLNPSKSHASGLGRQNDRLVEAFKEALLSPAILRHRAEFCQRWLHVESCFDVWNNF